MSPAKSCILACVETANTLSFSLLSRRGTKAAGSGIHWCQRVKRSFSLFLVYWTRLARKRKEPFRMRSTAAAEWLGWRLLDVPEALDIQIMQSRLTSSHAVLRVTDPLWHGDILSLFYLLSSARAWATSPRGSKAGCTQAQSLAGQPLCINVLDQMSLSCLIASSDPRPLKRSCKIQWGNCPTAGGRVRRSVVCHAIMRTVNVIPLNLLHGYISTSKYEDLTATMN